MSKVTNYKTVLYSNDHLCNRLKLYVPTEMVNNLIRSIHEQIGYLGVEKCCNQIDQNYWFPNRKTRIINCINNCLKCIIYSAPSRINNRNLHSIQKESYPFDTLHIDHFGPLPISSLKKKYLLVVINAFTKFVKLYPITSTSTKEVCNALKQYFSYYSRPKRIISDRGTCFT